MCFLQQKSVKVPENVSIRIFEEDSRCKVTFSGSVGEAELVLPEGFLAKTNEDTSEVSLESNLSTSKPLLGTFAGLVTQRIEGVTQGFKKQLNLVGVGYRANLTDNGLNLKLGYSHEVHIEVGPELEIVCPNQTTIFVKGVDLEKVTQKAAEIRSWRLPEPYKGKGIFYKNETIRRKEGKKN